MKIGNGQITCCAKSSSYAKEIHRTDRFQWEVIEKFVSHHKPKKHSLRTILNAPSFGLRTGTQWRNLEQISEVESVYYYFYIWSNNGTWNGITQALVLLKRKRQGQARSTERGSR
ncbi:MAG: transposase [Bacteroidia bacterium]